MQQQPTARSWTFVSYLANLDFQSDLVKYAVYQQETCPDTGRDHWQGYFTAKQAIRKTGAQKIVGDPVCHVEIAKASAEQNRKYCTKTGLEPEFIGKGGRKEGTDFVEIGTLAKLGQGTRNDLQAVVEKVNDGATLEDIAEDFGVQVIKYGKGIERLIDLKRTGRDANCQPEVIIYWGDSGTGKTRKATEEFPDAYILSKPNKDGNVWWDGYQGEETVILDEFYGWIPYDTLLRLCDRYPYRVPYKGGHHKLKATRIIFTSNKPWKEWYPNIDDISAFERRVEEFGTVTHFKRLAQRDVN